jgi:hypothetical protein
VLGEELLQAKALIAKLEAEVRIKDVIIQSKDGIIQSSSANPVRRARITMIRPRNTTRFWPRKYPQVTVCLVYRATSQTNLVSHLAANVMQDFHLHSDHRHASLVRRDTLTLHLVDYARFVLQDNFNRMLLNDSATHAVCWASQQATAPFNAKIVPKTCTLSMKKPLNWYIVRVIADIID